MKTILSCKLIFETEEFSDIGEESTKPELTLTQMRDLINNSENDLTIECILDLWGAHEAQPAIYIKQEKVINKLSTNEDTKNL